MRGGRVASASAAGPGGARRRPARARPQAVGLHDRRREQPHDVRQLGADPRPASRCGRRLGPAEHDPPTPAATTPTARPTVPETNAHAPKPARADQSQRRWPRRPRSWTPSARWPRPGREGRPGLTARRPPRRHRPARRSSSSRPRTRAVRSRRARPSPRPSPPARQASPIGVPSRKASGSPRTGADRQRDQRQGGHQAGGRPRGGELARTTRSVARGVSQTPAATRLKASARPCPVRCETCQAAATRAIPSAPGPRAAGAARGTSPPYAWRAATGAEGRPGLRGLVERRSRRAGRRRAPRPAGRSTRAPGRGSARRPRHAPAAATAGAPRQHGTGEHQCQDGRLAGDPSEPEAAPTAATTSATTSGAGRAPARAGQRGGRDPTSTASGGQRAHRVTGRPAAAPSRSAPGPGREPRRRRRRRPRWSS